MFAQTPAAAPAPDTSAVVGTLGGKDFTVADLQKVLTSKEPKFADNYHVNPENAISTLMVFQYLTEEAEKRKLAERSDVKEQIQATITELLRRAVVDDERNNYSVSNAEIETFYNAHKAQFQQTKIKVIYIAFKSGTPVAGTSPEALRAAAQAAVAPAQAARSETEALTLALEIVKKVRDGLEFSKAVEQYSEDAPSKAAGGDYGFIKIDSAYPEDFRKAVLALKPGEISEPLHQPAGYYIIRGEEATTQPMGDVLTLIVDAIRKDHLNDWLKKVTDEHKFVVKDLKLLQSVSVPGVPPPLLAAPK
jgi:peptidyl-prolyl cis-trans isomerase C